jgi:hypothetical protein
MKEARLREGRQHAEKRSFSPLPCCVFELFGSILCSKGLCEGRICLAGLALRPVRLGFAVVDGFLPPAERRVCSKRAALCAATDVIIQDLYQTSQRSQLALTRICRD